MYYIFILRTEGSSPSLLIMAFSNRNIPLFNLKLWPEFTFPLASKTVWNCNLVNYWKSDFLPSGGFTNGFDWRGSHMATCPPHHWHINAMDKQKHKNKPSKRNSTIQIKKLHFPNPWKIVKNGSQNSIWWHGSDVVDTSPKTTFQIPCRWKVDCSEFSFLW